MFVASTAPKVPIWIESWVSLFAGNLKKRIPSELTSTKANSKKLELNPFSKIAKSGPGPLNIAWYKFKIASPPSPRLTTVPLALPLTSV